jgi:hypothetical protein
MGGLWRMVDAAAPSTAAVLLAHQACFDRTHAVQLVGVMMHIDLSERRARPRFWRDVIVLLGVDA